MIITLQCDSSFLHRLLLQVLRVPPSTTDVYNPARIGQESLNSPRPILYQIRRLCVKNNRSVLPVQDARALGSESQKWLTKMSCRAKISEPNAAVRERRSEGQSGRSRGHDKVHGNKPVVLDVNLPI